jgi:predicted PurR-regulated permease PerM
VPPRPLGRWGITWRTPARWALCLLVIWIILWFLRQTGFSLTPFVLGLLLAYLLVPIVSRLDAWLPRWMSVAIVYLAGLLLLGLALQFVVPPIGAQIGQIVERTPEWIERAEVFGGELIDTFYDTVPPVVQEQVDQQLLQLQETVQQNATAYAQRIGQVMVTSVLALLQTLTFLFGFLVIPFFLFFTLLTSHRLPTTINRLLHPRIRVDFWNIWRIIDLIFGNFVRSQVILGMIVGIMTFIGLSSLRLIGLDVPYIFLLSIIAGVGELIPVIGPILSAIPAMIVVAGNGWSSVLIVVILYVVIQQVESQVLVPRVIGTTLRLNPAILLILLVVAAATGGLFLVILVAPLVAISRDVFIYAHRRLREPPVPPAMAIADLVPPGRHGPLSESPNIKAQDRSAPMSRQDDRHSFASSQDDSRHGGGTRRRRKGLDRRYRGSRLRLAQTRLRALQSSATISTERAARLLGVSDAVLRALIADHLPNVAVEDAIEVLELRRMVDRLLDQLPTEQPHERQ